MPLSQTTESRYGPRYVAAFPIRAEWDTDDGVHVVSEGETENIGPEGTLVHQRNPAHPQAALQLLGETDEWRGIVWKEAEIKMHEAEDDYDEDELS